MILRSFFFILFWSICFSSACFSQNYTVNDYIEEYKDASMRDMREYGIPASIKLAQAILESGFGTSELAVKANNHFGIKCHGWPHRTYYKDDDEVNECFRSYRDPRQSYQDHSEFLSTRQRYAFLFDLDPSDYKGWARGLSKAGYATNPRYPQLLIRIIEEHELYKYDQMVINGDKMATRSSSRRDRRDFDPVNIYDQREIKIKNRIEYINAKPGDTPSSIAEEMEMWVWQIHRYNDIDEGHEFKPDDIVYLQRKRRRGEVSQHVVSEGETMHEISQMYGIRLNQLYRRNRMDHDSVPKPGQKLLLRGRVRR